MIVHDVSDPYFAEITRGLQRVATEHGRLLIICNSYRDPARELEYVEMLRAQQVAAIVLAGSGYHDAAFTDGLDREAGAPTSAAGGRVAVIGRHELPGDAVDAGERRRRPPARRENCFGLGHRRIGVIAGPQELTTTTDRLDRAAGRAADGPATRCPKRGSVYADFTATAAPRAAGELLDADPGLTALVALNDSMAVGALAVLRERGIPVPPSRSRVVGFDDMPIARDVTPALTTVRLPLVEMGARAMTLALDEGSGKQQRVVRFETALVVRDSTGPARPAPPRPPPPRPAPPRPAPPRPAPPRPAPSPAALLTTR